MPPKDRQTLPWRRAPSARRTTCVYREDDARAVGDPPHGQVEFESTIDPAKLKESSTTRVEGRGRSRSGVLLEGKWSVRARIAKDLGRRRTRTRFMSARGLDINVAQQKLRILLFAETPRAASSHSLPLLARCRGKARGARQARASSTTYVQNESGTGRTPDAEKDEVVLQQLPHPLRHFDQKKLSEEERPYNLNEYDLIIAFDPDWSELNAAAAPRTPRRWCGEGGGGVILTALVRSTPPPTGPQRGAQRQARRSLIEVLPVMPADITALQTAEPAEHPAKETQALP